LFVSRFAFAFDKSGVAQVILYYVCVASTYNPLLNGEISQIIRFFLTQNQSTLVLTKNVPILFSSPRGFAKRDRSLLEAIAIAFETDIDLIILSPRPVNMEK
jgi:hypothetical protein